MFFFFGVQDSSCLSFMGFDYPKLIIVLTIKIIPGLSRVHYIIFFFWCGRKQIHHEALRILWYAAAFPDEKFESWKMLGFPKELR